MQSKPQMLTAQVRLSEANKRWLQQQATAQERSMTWVLAKTLDEARQRTQQTNGA